MGVITHMAARPILLRACATCVSSPVTRNAPATSAVRLLRRSQLHTRPAAQRFRVLPVHRNSTSGLAEEADGASTEAHASTIQADEEGPPSHVWGGVVGSVANTLNRPCDVRWLGSMKLPEPDNSRIKTADYVSSAVRMDQMPDHSNPNEFQAMMRTSQALMPEIALIGRSNVGKSSLINTLTNKKGLAMVSKTPGKTRTINHFLINKDWYLVDLPGYGFAKVAEKNKIEWFGFTSEYFLERESLIMVLLLIDGSIPPQQPDIECLQWLADHEVPVSVVFTKLDKRKKKAPKPEQNVLAFEKEMLKIFAELPPRLLTSSATGHGKDQMLRYLASLRNWAKTK